MQQALIVARGIEVPLASKTQVKGMRAAVENLERDPRVKTVYGFTGHSTGLAILSEVPNWKEAERIASLARVYGLTDVEIFPLLPTEQLRTGLEEAEKIAIPFPQELVSSTKVGAGA